MLAIGGVPDCQGIGQSATIQPVKRSLLLLSFVLPGCPVDDTGGPLESESADTGMSTGEVACLEPLGLDPPDEWSCSALAGDYTPGGEDDYAACVVDDGKYHLVADTPSSIARVEAYEAVRSMLAGSPDADAFTEARSKYAEDEGLESRLLRREDLHFPPVPEADWQPGVDPDKQCTVESNVEKYPDRCAGPGKIAPLLNDAFSSGQTGSGTPEVEAAKIDAALLWFLYLSVFKEASTCFSSAEKDCDSSWAYYTGGTGRESGMGLSRRVRDISVIANDGVWNGFAAHRCLREHYPQSDYETFDDLPREATDLLEQARQQLEHGLTYAWSRVVRARLEEQASMCATQAEANWAWLQIAGPVLDHEARARGGYDLQELWTGPMPDAEMVTAAVANLDAVFACPQP